MKNSILSRIKNNRLLKDILKLAFIITGCLVLASYSPSLDGRAIVVEPGVFPEGLFAKTVGYLPGDIISVTNITGDSTVDLLVIGALDPSEGVAIMLSPEAADAIGISRNANNIVKITKRSNQDERVYGSAVIATQNKQNEPETSIPEPEPVIPEPETVVPEPVEGPEESFEDFAADDVQEYETETFEENLGNEEFEDAETVPYVEEEIYSIPVDEEPEEEPVVEYDYVDDELLPELDEEPLDQAEYIESTDENYEEEDFVEEEEAFEPEEENSEPEEEITEEESEVVEEEIPEEEPIEEEFYEEYVDDGLEDLEEEEFEEETVEEEPAEEIEEAVEEEPEEEKIPEPEEEVVEEEEPLEEEFIDDEELPEQPYEDEEYVDEELEDLEEEPLEEETEDFVEEETEDFAEEESEDFAEEESEDFAEEETVVPEEETEETTEEEFVDEEPIEELIEDEPVEEDEVEVLDDEEYDAIVLVPAEDNPPEEPLNLGPFGNVTNSAITDIEEEEIEEIEEVVEVEDVEPIVIAPTASVVQPAVTGNETSYSKFMIESLNELEAEKYYIQIATLRDDENILEIVNKYGQKYPITIVPAANGAKQVLVGPVTLDEYGTVLARFKAYGYKDAFLRKGTNPNPKAKGGAAGADAK